MILGSPEHKNLYCRFFIYSHKVFKPADITWPDLPSSMIETLKAIPVWDQLIQTGHRNSKLIKAYSEKISDPLAREAVSLLAYEEGRQAEILEDFLNVYKIPLNSDKKEESIPENLRWEFFKYGSGQTIDIFFGLGLPLVVQATKEFPREFLKLVSALKEEKARHLLFFQNWIIHHRYQRSMHQQFYHFLQNLWAFGLASKIRLWDQAKNESKIPLFLVKRYLKYSNIGFREFIETSLKENKKYLTPYDPRLIRPKLVPHLMGFLRYFF